MVFCSWRSEQGMGCIYILPITTDIGFHLTSEHIWYKHVCHGNTPFLLGGTVETPNSLPCKLLLSLTRFTTLWFCLPTGPMWRTHAGCRSTRTSSLRRSRSCTTSTPPAPKSGSTPTHKQSLPGRSRSDALAFSPGPPHHPTFRN